MSGNKERRTLVQSGPLDRLLYRCRKCGSKDWIHTSYSKGRDLTMLVYRCAECNRHKGLYYQTRDLEEDGYFEESEED